MCIYYTNRSDLHYTSGEHIIPAGLGGIKKLPVDYVSSEFNNDISKLEREFIRNSFPSAARPIVGPGKRGKMGPQHASRSSVAVLVNRDDPSQFSLGYLKLGRAYEIPVITYNTTTHVASFSFDKTENADAQVVLDKVKQKLLHVEPRKMKLLEDNNLPPDIVLLGIADKIEGSFEFFFAKHPGNLFTITSESAERFAKGFAKNEKDPGTPLQYQPKVLMTLKFKEEHYRIYGKIAFNFLAHLKGKDFVLQDIFDPVRNWIAEGGKNQFAVLFTDSKKIIESLRVPVPEWMHFVYLIKIEDSLTALVMLYEGMAAMIRLADHFNKPFNPDAWVCDWKNHTEYRLAEYISKAVHENFSDED